MCGIFGMVNGTQDKFNILGMLNEARGTDSWGIFNGREIFKNVGPFRRSLSVTPPVTKRKFMLGHTRAATHGGVSLRNAHPFEYGKIVSAHNGVITNWHSLSTRLQSEEGADAAFLKAMQVDSEIFSYLLATDKTRSFSELYGYAAIWWFDKRTPDVFYLWASNNSLYISVPKKNSHTLYFSSQSDHLEAIGCVNHDAVKDGRIVRVNVHTAEIEDFGVQAMAVATSVYRGYEDAWDIGGHGKSTYTGGMYKGGLFRGDYLEAARLRHQQYQKAESSSTPKAIVPATGVETDKRKDQRARWHPNQTLSKKKQKRLVHHVNSVRKAFDDGKLTLKDIRTLNAMAGVPIRTGICDNCNVEWPWAMVVAEKPGFKDAMVAPCPRCGRTIHSCESLWCGSCKRVVSTGEVEIDDVRFEGSEVLVCPTCDEYLEDLFTGEAPVQFVDDPSVPKKTTEETRHIVQLMDDPPEPFGD